MLLVKSPNNAVNAGVDQAIKKEKAPTPATSIHPFRINGIRAKVMLYRKIPATINVFLPNLSDNLPKDDWKAI